MTRRPFLTPLLGLILATTVLPMGLTGTLDPPVHHHGLRQADQAPAGAGTGAADAPPPKVTVQLTVQSKIVNVLGVPFEAWTYNGVVPGTIIRVSEGTELDVVLVNGHDQTHSVHTHLRDNFIASDGSSDTAPLPIVPHQHNMLPVGQNPIGPSDPRPDRDVADPGASYTYHFTADTPGNFLYHCHVFNPTEHISRGLFGLILVYPKGWTWEELPPSPDFGNTKAHVTDAAGNTYFEDVVMISELTPVGSPSPGVNLPVTEYPSDLPLSGMTPPAVGKINLANFRAWNDPYIVGPVRPNERVLLHVANIGDELHDWHVHSHWFDVLDKISREKKPLWTADTLLLGPGDSYDTALTAGKPGYWFMHDHIVPDALTGMVPWLLVQGDPAPNVPPTVEVAQPIDGGVVAGRVLLQGTANDFEGRERVRSVEYRVDDDAWQPVQGLLEWRLGWDSTLVPDGMHTIEVRSFDGQAYSKPAALGVLVHNAGLGLDGVANAATEAPAAPKGGSSPGTFAFEVLLVGALVLVAIGRRRAE